METHGKPSKPVVVSLFSGAMGLDLGLELAGAEIRVAVESNRHAAETIRHNRKGVHVIERKLEDVSSDELADALQLQPGESLVVAGGPSCQPFSLAGKRGSIGDPRGGMIGEFIRTVRDLRPRFYVLENVKGALSAAIRHRTLAERGPGHPRLRPDEELGSAFSVILNELKLLGYYTVFDILNAADFGVPQTRQRLIFLGSRDGEEVCMPSPTHSKTGNSGLVPWVSLRDALSGLEEDEPLYRKLSSDTEKYLRRIPIGGNWTDLPVDTQEKALGGAYRSWGGRSGFLRRLSWDRPAPSLTTDPAGKATMMCHPIQTRPLSVRECGRIQQFPDTWYFAGGMSQQYTQIGNAVPVGLGRALGEALNKAMVGSANTELLGKVACYNEEVLRRLARRPRTMLNPPWMRADKDPASAKKWVRDSNRKRNDVWGLIDLTPANYSLPSAKLRKTLKRLAIVDREAVIDEDLPKLRRKSRSVTKILHETYGMPNHDNKTDPLDELIFIVLSQMTTQKSFGRVFNRLKAAYPTWEGILQAQVSDIEGIISDGGLSLQKGARIKEIVHRLKEDLGEVSLQSLDQMPNEEIERYLRTLPGVGLKTAKCVMMYSLGRSVLPVDTHVSRVSRRLGLIPFDLPTAKIHDALERVTSAADRYSFHVNAVSHGRDTCVAKRPRCNECSISKYCDFVRRDLAALIDS